MSVASRIQELKRKHKSLSDAVEAAQIAPAADSLEIAALKRQKLALKEEIDRLSGG